MTPLERCMREEAECAKYIHSGGPDQRGARQGVDDWIMEQALIETDRQRVDAKLEGMRNQKGLSSS